MAGLPFFVKCIMLLPKVKARGGPTSTHGPFGGQKINKVFPTLQMAHGPPLSKNGCTMLPSNHSFNHEKGGAVSGEGRQQSGYKTVATGFNGCTRWTMHAYIMSHLN